LEEKIQRRELKEHFENQNKNKRGFLKMTERGLYCGQKEQKIKEEKIGRS